MRKNSTKPACDGGRRPPNRLTGLQPKITPLRGAEARRAAVPGAPAFAAQHFEPAGTRVQFCSGKCRSLLRDGVFDLGRASAPRITVPHILPSETLKASASAILLLSRLNRPPCTTAVYASPWSSPPPAQHSLPGGRYPYLGRTFTGWISPASWRTSVSVWIGWNSKHLDGRCMSRQRELPFVIRSTTICGWSVTFGSRRGQPRDPLFLEATCPEAPKARSAPPT